MKTLPSLNKLKETADHYTWELYLFSNENTPTTNCNHRFLNVLRRVEKKQTNAIMFEGGSWLYWTKATNYKIENYLYNETDLILTIKEADFPFMGYHLRPINKN